MNLLVTSLHTHARERARQRRERTIAREHVEHRDRVRESLCCEFNARPPSPLSQTCSPRFPALVLSFCSRSCLSLFASLVVARPALSVSLCLLNVSVISCVKYKVRLSYLFRSCIGPLHRNVLREC